MEGRNSSTDDKRDVKMRQLAESTISALEEHGYANTTLRDIAKQSRMSLGTLHYYFKDKDELLLYCVGQFKMRFVEKIGSLTRSASSQSEIVDAMGSGLVLSLVGDAKVHRLWYDMRSQAMYDPVFRTTVTAIELALLDLFSPLAPNDPIQRDIIYGAVDGLFRYFLQRHLSGERLSPGLMESSFQKLINRLV